jgi:hypothetical protein
VAGVDDWYLDHAHRHELTPGYSADDDVPDPVVFGEVPGAEWTVPGTRTTGSPGRSRRASLPKSNGKRSPTKNTVQITSKPTANTRHQQSSGRNRGRRFADWQGFALRWLRAHPGASNRELKAAVEEAGFLPLVKAEIADLRAQVGPARKAPRRNPASHVPPRTARPAPATNPVRPVRYCDSCGLAVTNDGRCRC